MSKIIRPILFIAVGITIGLLIHSSLGLVNNSEIVSTDTSLVKIDAANQTYNGKSDISRNRRNALTLAVEMVSPAVVSVNVTKIREYIQRSPFSGDPFFREFFPEIFRDRKYRELVKSIGSGFIISKDGYILTNEHVVENAAEVIIAISNGNEYKAEIVGVDHVSDIALLKMNRNDLPYVSFGDSDKLMIGEWAIALGNPFGLFVKGEPTVTVGVISAVDRDFGRLNSNRIYQDMIQTDASINNGNSGGPLCNADGEVIGVNTFIYTGDARVSGSVGIGFAIPINRIKRIINDLKQYHGIDRNFWTGMYYSNLTRFLARELGYSSTLGVYVARIDKNSPAEKAGVQLGDIVIKVNDQEIREFSDVENAILSTDLKVGDNLNIRVWRNSQEYDLTILLEKYKK